MSNLDLALSVALGIGLAAATGFRLFLPLLILSVAAYTGHASLNESFAWLATPAAVIMLGTAAIVEIAAFYIPGVDNLLDTVATPGAVVAGTIVSAAVMTDLPPMVKWTAAIIAGGGVAGITQGLTAMLRAKSTVFTGGLGNSAVATAELPRPPVKTVDFARSIAVNPCVMPATPPPAIMAAVHFTIGGRSVMTAADTIVPATTAPGVATVSSRLSTPGM